MFSRICYTAIAVMVAVLPVSAVEYEGEKSILLEMRYEICPVPPQEKEAAAKGIKVIGVKEAKRLHEKGAYFYDAREKRHFNAGHIKGAKPIDFDRSKAQFVAIELPKDKKESLVFYCYGESCANSYEAALAVKKEGYSNVYWMLNGYSRWKINRYPME